MYLKIILGHQVLVASLIPGAVPIYTPGFQLGVLPTLVLTDTQMWKCTILYQRNLIILIAGAFKAKMTTLSYPMIR
jgi:hypothetical protein